MNRKELASFDIPLFFSRSHASTEANNTGNWSFIQPRYRDRTAPCSEACPCGTDIPRVESLASEGNFADAWRTILMENPLPGVCGRVCFHPCEKACNRGELDEAVSVNALERFLSDAAFREGLSRVAAGAETAGAPKGKRIAVIGSGPAGLSAAAFLARLGHSCEIFESAPEAGGLLRYGIPAYRLPSDVLAREIAAVERLGVKLHCGSAKPISFLKDAQGAKEGGFDAVFVACGQAKTAGLSVPGEELASDGLEFLRRVRSGESPKPAAAAGERVAVIGGGNTAIDVARTLLRQGLKPLIVYRRRREDMPAFGHEVDRALAEGAELMELYAPLSLEREGKGLSLSLQKMKSCPPGADGRNRIEPIPGEKAEITVAAVYAAIGAGTDDALGDFMRETKPRKLGRASMAFRPFPLAFLGDLSVEEKSVSEAIASGKEAALALDAFFKGGEDAVEKRLDACRVGDRGSLSMEIYLGGARAGRDRSVVRFSELNAAYFPRRERTRQKSLAPRASISGFDEVESALDSRGAMGEAERCMSCGTCNDCDNCRSFCPEAAVRLLAGDRDIDKDHCKGCGVCVEECPRGAMAMGQDGGRQ